MTICNPTYRLFGVTRLFTLFLLAVSAAVPLRAETRSQMHLVWAVLPSDAMSTAPILVSDGDLVLRNRLVPIAMAELGEAFTQAKKGSLSVAAGAQLYAVTVTTGERVFCAWEVQKQAKDGNLSTISDGFSTICFLDRQSDGRFEARFEANQGREFPQIQMPFPKEKHLMAVDLPYAAVPSEGFKGELWVGLKYEEYFNIYGSRMLMVAFGGRGKDRTLTEFSKFKANGPFPQQVGALGARLSILEARDSGSLIRIDLPITSPVFAVVSTTTVRLY